MRHRDLPPFPALRAFEAAARHLSFQRAADELHVTGSAVSHQVRRLEEFLEVRLFLRQPGRVSLTPAGSEYRREVAGFLDGLAASTARARRGGRARRLRLRTTPAFAARWLLPRLPDLQTRHPDLELEVTTSVEAVDFDAEPVDVVVQYGAEPAAGASVVPLLHSSRAPVCTPALRRSLPPLRRPADLRRRVLLRDMVGDGWSNWFAAAGLSPPPPGGPVFEHCELTLRAAEAGQGVALGYLALLRRELEEGRLQCPFELRTAPRVIYSIALPGQGRHHPGALALVDWLRERVAADEAPASRVARMATPP